MAHLGPCWPPSRSHTAQITHIVNHPKQGGVSFLGTGSRRTLGLSPHNFLHCKWLKLKEPSWNGLVFSWIVVTATLWSIVIWWCYFPCTHKKQYSVDWYFLGYTSDEWWTLDLSPDLLVELVISAVYTILETWKSQLGRMDHVILKQPSLPLFKWPGNKDRLTVNWPLVWQFHSTWRDTW